MNSDMILELVCKVCRINLETLHRFEDLHIANDMDKAKIKCYEQILDLVKDNGGDF